ncbi:hypothetical protein ETAA8_05390 [Anatilimnocola aggregata]|uniref:Uncharacterized protein n=1 Tax=Anatilimnocola aggregata TaxID=2528021 RepID=A0A517Y5E8_9BACT|nr:hypothetical protein [Anatilimnocola aggregata]QDU25471.1 hypothetical protein ETAA8_05390 [Anatilimnocola aggregata]
MLPMEFDYVTLVVIGAIFLAFVLLVPISLFFTQRFSLRPQAEVFVPAPETMPPVLFTHFANSYLALQRVGFELLLCVKAQGMKNVVSHVASLVNRQTLDSAVITALTVVGTPHVFLYVEIFRRYRNGEVVQTNNSPVLMGLPEPAYCTFYQLPQISDPSQLFQIHQLLIERAAPQAEAYLRLDEEFGDNPIACMQTIFEEAVQDEIRRGLFYQPAGTDYARFTVYGSLRAGWSLIFPVSLVRRILRDRRAQQLVQEVTANIPVAELK